MTDCAVWWAEPITATPTALALLDSAERQRYEAYRRPEDQRRFLTGRVLAKTVAASRLDRRPEEIRFDATCEDCGKQHGPVRVPGAALQLSISHAGDRVGVAATSGAPVGLDVEATRRDADDSLISYALTETEQASLPSDPKGRAQAFFVFWTRKEALMKATGRGLRIPLRSLTLSGADEPARLLAAQDGSLSPATTRMTDLDPGHGYRAAVAVITSEEIDVTESWWTPEAGLGGQ
ncbi:4'-phosphopantetheinyl transferase family protein [Saccharomonospora glauca]|jgi:4'-phosphopantetheinyl transferase|uniref:Phosphopantetheinyl transferase n=1 Tax=Saccharomonospora glauca K62 TaxID=928724 RepID=I1D6I7_9PSEU|nr:4'-phosphopantetheinyl transferase superfamily protein [Saccharomonospora glauca]EIF00562.1 phosphopantetheinyl transferase [Saccharomonospora glauca K62]